MAEVEASVFCFELMVSRRRSISKPVFMFIVVAKGCNRSLR